MFGNMTSRRACFAVAAVCIGLAVRAADAGSSPGIASVSIRQLVEVVDIGSVSVSPDGRRVAFRTERASVERNTYDTVWYVQPTDGSGPPRRLGEGGAPLRTTGGLSAREPVLWSPDGRWIFYRAVFAGRVEVWRAAVDGSRTEPVVRDPANVRQFSLSADGSILTYSVGATREAVRDAERAEYDHGVHIDRTVPLGDDLYRSGFHEGRLATQRLVDNELERFPLLHQAPDHWKTVDLATGAIHAQAVDALPAKSAATAGLSKRFGRIVSMAEDYGSGHIALLVHSGHEGGKAGRSPPELAMLRKKASRSLTKCAASPCVGKPITNIVWRPGGAEVVFTVTAPDDRQSIFRWIVASGAVVPVVASSGQVGGGGRWEPGSCGVSPNALVCVTARADRPPRLERIELDSGKRDVLFDPNEALARNMAQSVPVREIHWVDAHGTRFSGQFYPAKPQGHKPPPLFIAYYRCSGFLRGGVGDEWPLAPLALHGISALCINAPPTPSDAVKRYRQGQSAVESAVAYLGSLGDIDPDRVGMGGLSFGAEVTMWNAMYSHVPRAISVSTPVVSPMARTLFGLWGDVYASRLKRFWQLGSPKETPERWRLLSPYYDAGRIKVPVLMQMSEQEYRSGLDYIVPLIREHRADVYVFPNEPHQKFQPQHKLAVYERNLDWFRFWLLGMKDSDPAKSQQYARWEEMRESLPSTLAKR